MGSGVSALRSCVADKERANYPAYRTSVFYPLEASVKPAATLVIGQKVCVGKEGREEIDRIKGRIKYDSLTNSARDFLPNVLKKIVTEKEKDFIHFFNNAKPISIRVHTLDLLPGIGKKNMEAILAEREKQPFESFEDIKKRVPAMTDPVSIFIHRIIAELEGTEKYYLFVKPPFERPPGGRPSFGRRRF